MRGVRLTKRISVVGGGSTGLGTSHVLDPNVYLLSGGEELALVDAGAGPGEDRILKNNPRTPTVGSGVSRTAEASAEEAKP